MSVKGFQNVLTLQQVITPRHSKGFQCNFVHEQTSLFPTNCSQKIYDLFLSFLYSFGFSKKIAFCRLRDEYWAANLESLGLNAVSNTVTSKPCIISKYGLIVHKINILLSQVVEWTSILDRSHGSNTSHLNVFSTDPPLLKDHVPLGKKTFQGLSWFLNREQSKDS